MSTSERVIRRVLADDHPLVREGISGMLAGFDDNEVVGQATNGPAAVVHPQIHQNQIGSQLVDQLPCDPRRRSHDIRDGRRRHRRGPSGSVRAAASGETVLAQSAASTLLGRARTRIGRTLHVSETTVKTYLARAFDKLGVSDRTSAVARAIDLGLIGSQR